MWKVRELADKVTNVVMNYTEIEAKVREATNDDHWGPTGAIRHELSQATFSYDLFPEVMGMLWKRIAENKKNPRRIYKSLILLHHLLLNGSDRVVRSTQDRIYEIRSLQDYHVVYEPGFNIASILPPQEFKDGEANVRVKSKEIVDLLQDEDRLKEDRKKSKKNRDKYVGISSDRSMGLGSSSRSGGGGGGGGGSGGSWKDYDEDDEYRNSSKYSPPFTRSSDHANNSGSSHHHHSSSSPSATSNYNSRFHRSRFIDDPPPPSSKTESGVEADEDTDFNPRSNEFGDFKSASTPTTAGTTNNNNQMSNKNIGAVKLPVAVAAAAAAKTAPSSVQSTAAAAAAPEFADFQSAFASGSSPGTAAAAAPAPDLLNHSSSTTGATTATSSNFDLLGIIDSTSLANNQFQSFQFHQQQNNIGGGGGPMYHNNQQSVGFPAGGGNTGGFDAFAGIPPTAGGGGGISSNADLLGSNIAISGGGAGGGGGGGAAAGLLHPGMGSSLLQPISPTGSATGDNHLNNNVNAQDKSKTSLKGTTWSDLNLSLDDVNLSGRQKVAPPKPSMRQMSFGQ